MGDFNSHLFLYQGAIAVGLDESVRPARHDEALRPPNNLLLLNADDDEAGLKASINHRRHHLENFILSAGSEMIKLPNPNELTKLMRPHLPQLIKEQYADPELVAEHMALINQPNPQFNDIKYILDLSQFSESATNEIHKKCRELFRKQNPSAAKLKDEEIPVPSLETAKYRDHTQAHVQRLLTADMEKRVLAKLDAIESDPTAFLKRIHASQQKEYPQTALHKIVGLLDYVQMRPKHKFLLQAGTMLSGPVIIGCTTLFTRLDPDLRLYMSIAAVANVIGSAAAGFGIADGMHMRWRLYENNPPRLTYTNELLEDVKASMDKLPEDVKGYLNHIKPVIFISATLNYLIPVEDIQLLVGGSAGHLYESSGFTYSGSEEEEEGEKKIARERFRKSVIHMTGTSFGTMFEEAKHTVHHYVGYPEGEWKKAAMEEICTTACRELLGAYGNKSVGWWNTEIYSNHDKSPYAAETLVEMEHVHYCLTTREGKSSEEAFTIIDQHMPRCGKLFREYKAREAALLEAIHEGNESKINSLRMLEDRSSGGTIVKI